MADRRDFYFRQKVTEAELDDAFSELELADRAITSDLGLVGVAVGMAVAQQASANLTVQVSGPGVVYDQTGQRVAIPSTQNVNCAVDEGALSTAVVTPGNSKILSIFVEFDRALSDPRVDGSSVTVFFVRAESFQFNVAASAEAGTPTAPSLRSDQILLADVTLIFGQTQILNADISTTRRQWMFKTTGTVVAVGTPEEAIQELATAIGTNTTGLAAHLADATAAHAASAIASTPAGSLAATDVQSALNELATEKLALAGGTMTGALIVNNDVDIGGTTTLTGDLHAASMESTAQLLFTNAGAFIAFDADGHIRFGVPADPAALANPGKNRIHAKNTAKVWASLVTDGVGGVTMSDGYGVASVALTGVSPNVDIRVTFSNAFTNVTSMAPIMNPSGGEEVAYVGAYDAAKIDIRGRDLPGMAIRDYSVEVSQIFLVIFGEQS